MVNANEQRILNLVRTKKAQTQAELSRITGINSSTMTYILGRLKSKKQIISCGKQITGPGKPGMLLRCNHPGLVICVDIDGSRVLVGIMDAGGQILCKHNVEMADSMTPQEVLAACHKTAKTLANRIHQAWRKMQVLGLSVSGYMSAGGILEFSTVLPWRNIPIRQMAEEIFGLPVFCSDGRYRAVAECRLAAYKDYQSILYFNAADGVSVRHVLNGELFNGSAMRSGEIGHLIFEADGQVCGCGQRGCLQALISGPGICQKIVNDSKGVRQAANKPDRKLLSAVGKDYPSTVIDVLTQLALEGRDSYSKELLSRIVSYAARGLAMAIACFDPQLIVIDGYVFRQRQELLGQLKEKIRQCYSFKGDNGPEVRSTILGEEARLLSIGMLCGDHFIGQNSA